MEDYDNVNDPLLGFRKEDDNSLDETIQKNLREGFIAKVFGILAYQIVLLFLVVLLAFVSDSFRKVLLTSKSLYFLTLIISLSCLIIPINYPKLFVQVPTNYIILTIFTLSYSWWIAFYTVHFTPESVLLAIFLTFVTVACISLYALYTKNDYTFLGGFLFTSLTLLIICGLFLIFFPIRFLFMIYLYFGLIIFCAYLLYDVQLLVGNGARKFGEDEYILAAINIYLDIIGIFIRILELVGKRKN